MKKPKKINVRFFLNKSIQPIIEGKTKRYPLYMAITYNRKNTMMKSHYGEYYKDLNEIDTVHYPGLLAFEERNVQKTVLYEIGKSGDDFDLKGIHKKYEVYSTGVHVILSTYLKNLLWMAISKSGKIEYAKALNFSDPDVSFDTLFFICSKTFSNLSKFLNKTFGQELESYNTFTKIYKGAMFQYNFPTAIEWLDQSGIEDYKRKLDRMYKGDKNKVEINIFLISKIVLSAINV